MTTTNFKMEAIAPANVRPSSVSKTRAFAAHRANRELPTQTVLDLLKARLPNDGGSYLIAGPGWKGATPKGIKKVLRCETELTLAVYRT
jgi:hypothetical protein